MNQDKPKPENRRQIRHIAIFLIVVAVFLVYLFSIFDFDDDIYGHDICLEFIGFLRLEFKLGSIDELRQQLTRDRDKSRALLDAYLVNRKL